MKIIDNYLNIACIVHGDAIFTSTDFTFAAASDSREYLALAINTSISFLNTAKSEILYATAKDIERNKK